jgi:hypothetical protein
VWLFTDISSLSSQTTLNLRKKERKYPPLTLLVKEREFLTAPNKHGSVFERWNRKRPKDFKLNPIKNKGSFRV